MKTKCFTGLIALIFIWTMGISNVKAGPGTPAILAPRPIVAVSPFVVPLDKKTKLVIMGSGYSPGQELRILCEDAFGVIMALEVESVVANERGSWAVVWTLGRYARKKVVTEGVYAIMAADTDYNILATTPVGLVNATKDPKQWPDWAKAAKIKPQKKKK
jgi:hypothetical protein